MNGQLRIMADLRDRALQKNRIAFGNRVSAIERGDDQANGTGLDRLKWWQERFQELEKEADADLRKLAKEEVIIERMVKVKGVGLINASLVVAMIDIERASTVSALWRYAGYGVTDGKRDHYTKGESAKFNRRLKIACRKVGEQFMMHNSPYKRIYDSSRDYYLANRPEWIPLRQHNAALDRMIKIWLQHLWIIWREMEGLPTNQPYAMDRLGHEHYLRPGEFGW